MSPLVCVFNATPVPRDDYWLGVPDAGRYEVVFDSDHPDFGGSGFARRQRLRGLSAYRARLSPCHPNAPAAAGGRVPAQSAGG